MRQDLKNKAGEVKFRARLYGHQVLGNDAIQGELSSAEMLGAMRERMRNTRADLAELASKNLLQSPFLELGAERCQRSLVLANEFGLDGYAADLSLESLLYADFLVKQEGFSRMPHRVCCDAYRLPFADNSIAFAFCYQTLHHFPDPSPIVQELYRVLRPGGVLYVNEEPIQRTWKLNLWRRHVRPKGGFENKYWRYAKDYVLDFVSEPHVNEVDFGICENDDISLRQWERILGEPATKEIQLKLLPIPRAMSRVRHTKRWGLRSWLCQGLGGVLSATIRAKDGTSPSSIASDALCCPACRGRLNSSSTSLTCTGCHVVYPVHQGVSMLLPSEELKTLYAEVV